MVHIFFSICLNNRQQLGKPCLHFITNEQGLQPLYAIPIMSISSSEPPIIRFRRVTERKLYCKLESDKHYAGNYMGYLQIDKRAYEMDEIIVT